MTARTRPMRALAQLLLLASCLLAGRVFAVSLGDELILSRLGDPVEIEIEVLQWEDMDLERVEITAASRAEYDVFELTWLPVLDELNFNLVGPDLDGNVRVLISSRTPLNEPFLELLLVLRWPGGSLRREYVLLFDPPGTNFTAAPPAATEAAPVAATLPPPAPQPEPLPTVEPEAEPARLVALIAESREPVANTPAPLAEPAPTQREQPATAVAPSQPREPEAPASEATDTAQEPSPQVPNAAVAVIDRAGEARPGVDEAIVEPEPASVPEPATEPDARTQVAIEVDTLAPQAPTLPVDTTRRMYQVRAGDSLWNIARQFRPAGAGDNLYQMLLGIHDLNRGSFINGNISLLKANALLQMPTENDIAAIDAAGAEVEFDRRWDAGTARFDAVQRGEAIPLFANSAPVKADEPFVEPDLPPGVEAPASSDADDLIMVSAANTPQPLQLVAAPDATSPEVEPTATATGQTRPEAVPGEGELSVAATGGDAVAISAVATAPASTTTLVVPSQTAIVVSRASVTAALETEVAAMRTRRASAEALAQQLQASLQRAQEERAAEASLFNAENLLLAGSALGLLVGLLAAGVFTLRIAGELRAQRNERDSSVTGFGSEAQPAWLAGAADSSRGTAARREPSMPDMEVVELPGTNANAVAEGSPRPVPSDGEDLFARMDDILGSSANLPEK